uniref:maturase K n=1 Tax=Ceratopteris thalictroides TaxID=29596 RepID=UPI001FAFCB26|nr:maturase K [Ceratopteris thalictroides]UJH19085.1 maturase K [Ceratopteris thalictroides]
MKVTYGSYSTLFDTLQKYKKFSTSKDCFSYLSLLLFEENVYLINIKPRSNESDIKLNFGTRSTVAVKRLIISVRKQNYSNIINSKKFVRKSIDRLNTDLYFFPIFKLICLMLGFSLFHRAETNIIKSNFEMSQSIHSIFLFLEDRFPKSQHILNMDLPQNLHLEIPIRLFRQQIKDVSFPHLLRIFFCKSSFRNDKNYFSPGKVKKTTVNPLLQNFHLYGIDFLLNIAWTKILKLRINSVFSIDRHNVMTKEKNVSLYLLNEFESEWKIINSFLTRNLCIHYARYKNRVFIAVEGTRYFAKKWSYYFLVLLNSYFHYQTRMNQLHLKLLYTNYVSLLGYTSIRQLFTKAVCIETTKDLYISISNEEKLYPKIPILNVINILSKHKFCDHLGRPIGQISWAILTDDQILNRYVKLWQVFSLYYDASTNRDKLGRLKYILQISCNSTLACKHKSTIRLLQRKFHLEKVSQFNLFKSSGHSRNKRVWHLTLIPSVLSEVMMIL